MMMNTALARELQAVLLRTGLTISTAESIPAGRIASLIASVDGASAYLRGGIIAYHIDTKVGLLGVEREQAEAVNCVSEQVARQMASGVRKVCQTDIGVSATGYAGPWPEEGIEVPMSWIGLDCLGYVSAYQMPFPIGTFRQEVQQGVAEGVLQSLLDFFEDVRTDRAPLEGMDPDHAIRLFAGLRS